MSDQFASTVAAAQAAREAREAVRAERAELMARRQTIIGQLAQCNSIRAQLGAQLTEIHAQLSAYKVRK